jgi:hypothetical protein
LRSDRSSEYEALSNEISLVVVDEGHYEPAIEWGKSVKGLETRTLLLTATPYRNDLKLFRITDPTNATHHFKHHDAVEQGIIRDVQFNNSLPIGDIDAATKAFVTAWNTAKSDGKMPSKSPRAIIYCADHIAIEKVVARLVNKRIKAIGIHDRFEKRVGSILLHKVPKPKENEAEVWVHQNKLTEGLDDSRFCFLALFAPIRNDRKLIQQIGRILRKTKEDQAYPAIVLSSTDYATEENWNSYLAFEQNLNLLDPQHFRDVVDTMLASQPDVEYFDGRFRSKFNPGDLAANPQVIIPPNVLVRLKGNKFSLDKYVQDCTDTINLEDAVILGPDLNGPCQKSASFALWVYASVKNSRYLEKTSLYEMALETHCVVVSSDLIFLADSRGTYPTKYIDDFTSPLDNKILSRFFDDTFKPTEVTVTSTIPYDTSVRGSRLHGHNLLKVPAALTDRVQICSAVRGSSTVAGRRYMGLTSGRIRQEVNQQDIKKHTLDTFLAWTAQVASILTSANKQCPLLARYMPTCLPPTPVAPKTLCLDLHKNDIALRTTDGKECELVASAYQVNETEAKGKPLYTCTLFFKRDAKCHPEITLNLEYQAVKRRFWFSKKSGTSISAVEADLTKERPIADFLNINQDTILIGLSDCETVYQGRSFYKVDYSYAEQTLLDLIEHPAGISPCGTEKGTDAEIVKLKATRHDKFPKGSLFRLIAENELTFPFSPELIICADLGTECADFIIANFTERKMALIHAKVGKGGLISASAYHDIISQAMKNLAYLTPNAEKPDRVNSWITSKKWNKTNIPVLVKTPKACPEGIRLWNRIRSEIIQSSNAELFVILVTAGAFSYPVLKDAVEDSNKRTPETAQLLHLIDGLNGHARQLGVRLRIYDIPFTAPPNTGKKTKKRATP